MLSLVSTARAAGHNPGAYLADLYTRLAAGWPVDQRTELLPHVWVPAQ